MGTVLASVNVNKGLGTPKRRILLERWLSGNRVDVLLAQEPWAHSRDEAIDLEGFVPVSGNSRVFAWVAEHLEAPSWEQITDHVQRLSLGYVRLFNLYLSPYRREERAEQLRALLPMVEGCCDRPTLVVGDFNLAPRDVDGLVGERPSSFNNHVDRAPYADMIETAMLVDCTVGEQAEYSIVRRRLGQISCFRCDLCLASDYFREWISVRYDHSTREGPDAFTDHSGLLIDLPVSLEPSPRETGRLFSWRTLEGGGRSEQRSRGQSSHKTAMGRVNESAVARLVVEHLVPILCPRRLLDHGCGRGADIRYYSRHGLEAAGFDPSPTFGFTEPPCGPFDLVVSAFVLNVLADPWQRLEVLRAARDCLGRGGHVLVATRSSDVIQRAAAQGNWSPYNDGFLSSTSKDTFQRGVDEPEILALGARLGLSPAPEHASMPHIDGATRVLFRWEP